VRAFVIAGPGRAAIVDTDPPVAGPGQVVVDVDRVGLCGTDREFFTGEMAYLGSGEAAYPIRIGHEWSGRVAAVGDGVDPGWLGRHVTADTMLGCGFCDRCTSGRQHLCIDRHEIGIRHGWPGALAEQLVVPVTALYALSADLDPALATLVEPAANAWHSVDAAALTPGSRLLVVGAGAIGLLAAQIARANGAEVSVLGRSAASIAFARSLGFDRTWSESTLPDGRYDAVIDATDDPAAPDRALDLVEPGRRVVYIGISGRPSPIDSRRLVLGEITAVGVLSGSPGLAGAIELIGSGRIDPRPLVAAVVGLGEVASVLAGDRDAGWGPGPKVHVDPRR
jgi:2-desacetyl-2-hydroxyethyl bacteriochlorophyllide A dehydrogenase